MAVYPFLPQPRIAVAAGVLLLAGACSSITADRDLTSLRTIEPEGSEFTQALTREYLAFANFEADEMVDWRDAGKFALKGVRAARGTVVAPEDPADWKLPQEHRQTLASARKRLVASLDMGGREKDPENAAKAQASYDCWVEQQEENWQVDHIAACRTGYDTAMAAMDVKIGNVTGQNILDRSRIIAELAALPANPMRILFAFDSYFLDEKGEEVIRAAVKKARDFAANLIVTGHADRAGPDEYNEELSQARAAAVRDRLMKVGIKEDAIKVTARGETDPIVATEDGVREPRNRRVDIRLVPKDENVAMAPREGDSAESGN